jgi:hypothetical protein
MMALVCVCVCVCMYVYNVKYRSTNPVIVIYIQNVELFLELKSTLLDLQL